MSCKQYIIPTLPLSDDVETKAVMKQTTIASRKLGELNGIVEKIPNPEILIRTLSLQEAMDSSSIESIITTHDELYKAEILNAFHSDEDPDIDPINSNMES